MLHCRERNGYLRLAIMLLVLGIELSPREEERTEKREHIRNESLYETI